MKELSPEKKKALELIKMFWFFSYQDGMGNKAEYAKKNALICCDEITKELEISSDNSYIARREFWIGVRKEIEKA